MRSICDIPDAMSLDALVEDSIVTCRPSSVSTPMEFSGDL